MFQIQKSTQLMKKGAKVPKIRHKIDQLCTQFL